MRATYAVVFAISLAAAGGCDLLTPAMYKRDVTAVISGPPTLVVGATAQLTLSLSYSDDTTHLVGPDDMIYSVVLVSSNSAVATVSPMGLVTARSVGQTTITATPDVGTTGTGRLIPGSLVITVTP